MSVTDLDWVAIALRTTVYVGSIAAAGGILFAATVNGAAVVRAAIRTQVWVGVALLMLVEPLRYAQFQLAISGGDWSLAFDPTMRWMAFETPIGHAAALRIGASILILIGGLRWWPVSLAGAGVMIGSFAFEGHTASHSPANWTALAAPVLLLAHSATVHWWLGALVPLRAATAPNIDHERRAQLVAQFGTIATWTAALLVTAGAVLIALLSGFQLDLDRNHQLVLALKLFVFAAVLALAATNKLRWTPMLRTAPEAGRHGLRRSLNLEIGVCGAILVATAVMISFSPAP
ncbi:MAG: CopD family protein [Pseudomonadota bacterium]